MTQDKENNSKENLTNFLNKNKKVLIIVVAVVVVALAGFICGSVIGSNSKQKDLAAVDSIQYALTNESVSLEADELNARRETAMTALAKYTKKGGVAGVRANMLAAEIANQKADYDAAISYWNAAAAKDKKAYTAPIANYNVASCYEQLGNLDEAAANYKKAADAKDFVLVTHAKFSYARVLETQGKYAEAVAAYTELNDSYPNDTWAKIAKTRIITLKSEGKAE